MTCRLAAPLLLALAWMFLFPSQAAAMHIAEGILPANWAALWYAPAMLFLAAGMWVIKTKTLTDRAAMPLLGLAGAAIFLISVLPIPVPVAGTSSHPAGTPLGAILTGPFVSTALGAVALLLQALFLAHGGITTWGANIMSMAVTGSFVAYGSFRLLRSLRVSVFLAAFAAGLLGDWATYAVTAFELSSALSGDGALWTMFGAIALAFAPTQLPLGILEGLLTGGIVSLLYQRRPELLGSMLRAPGLQGERT